MFKTLEKASEELYGCGKIICVLSYDKEYKSIAHLKKELKKFKNRYRNFNGSKNCFCNQGIEILFNHTESVCSAKILCDNNNIQCNIKDDAGGKYYADGIIQFLIEMYKEHAYYELVVRPNGTFGINKCYMNQFEYKERRSKPTSFVLGVFPSKEHAKQYAKMHIEKQVHDAEKKITWLKESLIKIDEM